MSISEWRIHACGDDSTERGAFRKRRSKRQELTSCAERAIEFGAGYAWLDAEGEVVRLEGEHTIHSRKIES
jgi:hypothetical protein